jgi:hypothetical protein
MSFKILSGTVRAVMLISSSGHGLMIRRRLSRMSREETAPDYWMQLREILRRIRKMVLESDHLSLDAARDWMNIFLKYSDEVLR